MKSTSFSLRAITALSILGLFLALLSCNKIDSSGDTQIMPIMEDPDYGARLEMRWVDQENSNGLAYFITDGQFGTMKSQAEGTYAYPTELNDWDNKVYQPFHISIAELRKLIAQRAGLLYGKGDKKTVTYLSTFKEGRLIVGMEFLIDEEYQITEWIVAEIKNVLARVPNGEIYDCQGNCGGRCAWHDPGIHPGYMLVCSCYIDGEIAGNPGCHKVKVNSPSN